ncbi:MAG: hypothetical protein ABEH81_13815 [Halopenitus sp.]
MNADSTENVADPDVVYDTLVEQLREAPPSPTITALPDGSVDYRCRIETGAAATTAEGSEPPSRQQLGASIARGEHKSLRIVPEVGEPGGQAVNLASGAHGFGADVTLFGHLDAPAMPEFPFVTRSMGEPATVRILDFVDGALMLAEESGDILSWTFDDMRAAATDLGRRLDADVCCCCNWVSFPNMPTGLRDLADAALEHDADGIFVLDPGDVVGSDPAALRDLLDALSRLGEAYDVVLNGNRRELRALAGVVADGERSASTAQGVVDEDRMLALREAADLWAVVMHARPKAAAATADGLIEIPNLTIEGPERWTGGGDRFGAGLATALGEGWPIEAGLALGNAAASYYVTQARDPDPEALADFVASPEHRPGR